MSRGRANDPQPEFVAINQDKERSERLKQMTASLASNDDDEYGAFDGDDALTGGESLLSLVSPEMKTLSGHWLAALKDHAMLSLPEGTYMHSQACTPHYSPSTTHATFSSL